MREKKYIMFKLVGKNALFESVRCQRKESCMMLIL